MKKLCLLIVVLLFIPNIAVSAQDKDALLLFASYENESAIVVLNATTGEEQFITDSFVDAGWSPDGRVWVVDSFEGERRLRFFDAESGAETIFGDRLYDDDCFASLLWSPDGEQLAYFTGSEPDRALNMLTLADGSRYQLPVEQHEMPYWSPDGNFVLINDPFSSSSSRLLVASDGNQLLDQLENAVFSPDSRYLSYVDREGAAWLYELGMAEKIALDVPAAYPRWFSHGRYLLFDVYPFADSLVYYDVQNSSLHSIDVSYPIAFAAWTADESAVLLYADFMDYAEDVRATTLLRYDLVAGISETVLADTAWIGGVNRSGDWMAIRYSLTPLEDRYAPTSNLLIYKGQERIEAELVVADDWLLKPELTGFGNGFLIAARDGLYRFDSQSGSLEAIYLGSTTFPVWTVNGEYLAFQSANEQHIIDGLNIWNADSGTISIPHDGPRQIGIIGWQGSRLQDSLLYCGIG